MPGAPLVGVVAAAHRAIDAQLTALAGAPPRERGARLAELGAALHATAEAEEGVLFAALRGAVGDDVLTDTCTADHGEAAHRLEALASHPDSPGFEAAFAALAQDVRNHMRDETEALVPVLEEALGPAGAAELAVDFEQALGP